VLELVRGVLGASCIEKRDISSVMSPPYSTPDSHPVSTQLPPSV
jgi:hypothetical protein